MLVLKLLLVLLEVLFRRSVTFRPSIPMMPPSICCEAWSVAASLPIVPLRAAGHYLK